MPNTTNFNWTTPADTDLVKDGALAIRTLANGIDTSLVDLKGGTTGQVLSKATNTDLDFTWVAQDDSNAIQNAIIDAKGDLIVGSAADTPARLAAGTNGYLLSANSAATNGLEWVAAPSSGGMTLLSTTTLSGNAVNITGISGSYTDLQVVIVGAYSSTNAPIRMRFNNDSGANYARNYHETGGTGTGGSVVNQMDFAEQSTASTIDAINLALIIIPRYADTTHKKFMTFWAQGAYQGRTGLFAYDSTSAISELNFFKSAGNFSAGTVYIYGVK